MYATPIFLGCKDKHNDILLLLIPMHFFYFIMQCTAQDYIIYSEVCPAYNELAPNKWILGCSFKDVAL